MLQPFENVTLIGSNYGQKSPIGDNFLFPPIVFEEDEIEATIYLPHGGYQVNFSYGSSANVAFEFSGDVATLDYYGYMTSAAHYTATETGTNGLLLTLDMLTLTVDKNNVGSLVDGLPVETRIYYDTWQVEESKVLTSIGATTTVNLTGDDVAAGNVTAADLAWSSSDPAVVMVSGVGVIEAKNHGVAVIYATATDGNQFERTGPDWGIKAAYDMNGSGQPDLILQHTDGRVSIWIMDGVVKDEDAGAVIGTLEGWNVVGAGTVVLD